eukprot:g4272.t1
MINSSKRFQRRRCGNLLLIIFVLCVGTLVLFNLNEKSTLRLSGKSSLSYSSQSILSTSSNTMDKKTGSAAWSDDIPTFYIYDVFLRGEEMLSLRGECEASLPIEFCTSLFQSKSRRSRKDEAQLYLVPIFEPVSIDRESTVDAIERLRSDRYFLKFAGSNFIFVCYSSNCQSTARAVHYALTKVNRSIWISRNDTINWPCRKRVINVDEIHRSIGLSSEADRESHALSQSLKEAGKLIEGRNRWRCKGHSKWGTNVTRIFDFGTLKDTSFKSQSNKVAYCGVPKVGSSVTVLMMRRMNGMPDWKLANTVDIRNFKTGYKWRYPNGHNTLQMYDSTDWVKGMMVRNPITRLLSGYRSKIEDLREFSRIPGGWHKTHPPSFEEFVQTIVDKEATGTIDWIDRHFRPQSALCGVRTLSYDFIGRYENRAQDIKEFLESLELWESIGATGWGVNETGAIFSQDEQIVRKNKPKPVTHADSKSMIQQYYTEDLIKTVMDLYNEDFNRFGFSKNIDDYL